MSARDLMLLRRSIALAALGMSTGERPFGAVIATADGTVLGEAYAISAAQNDVTCHAEITAIRAVYGRFSRDDLARCTLYSSSEPCGMCAGAIYWANIRRVVFGLSEPRLRALRNCSEATAALEIRCDAVLATGGHSTVVIGGLLEDEAAQAHLAFWRTDA